MQRNQEFRQRPRKRGESVDYVQAPAESSPRAYRIDFRQSLIRRLMLEALNSNP